MKELQFKVVGGGSTLEYVAATEKRLDYELDPVIEQTVTIEIEHTDPISGYTNVLDTVNFYIVTSDLCAVAPETSSGFNSAWQQPLSSSEQYGTG